MIRWGESGPVKIGKADDPKERLGNLQVANWETLKIIRLFEGGEAEEDFLHACFADLNIRGDWHSFSYAMMGDVGLVEIPLSTPKLRAIPASDPNGHIDELLREIEEFSRKRRISETTFGLLSVNDGKFVGRLRSGKNMTLLTISKVREFIRAQLSDAPIQIQPGA